MDSQLGAGRAAFKAYGTHEPFVASMRDHMIVPGRGRGELCRAYLAAVRLLAGVRPPVIDQRRLLRELALAEVALEWPLASMHPHMGIQLGYLVETLATY